MDEEKGKGKGKRQGKSNDKKKRTDPWPVKFNQFFHIGPKFAHAVLCSNGSLENDEFMRNHNYLKK